VPLLFAYPPAEFAHFAPFFKGGCAKPICTFDYTRKARFGKGFLEGIFWLKEAQRWMGGLGEGRWRRGA
jgi:hypothetical protein